MTAAMRPLAEITEEATATVNARLLAIPTPETLNAIMERLAA